MAIEASEIRVGDVIRFSGALQKVQSVNLHTGGGKAGSMVHMKLRHLGTGHVAEQRFAPTEKVEKLDVELVPMEYLYNEGEDMVFMHPATFEQCRLSKTAIGPAADLLKEGTTINVELYNEKPIALDLPESVEIEVIRTGAGAKGDTTFKEAELAGGIVVKVPQFIKEGDKVRISLETREYLDRVHEKQEKAVFKAAPKKGGPEAPKPAASAPPASADKKKK